MRNSIIDVLKGDEYRAKIDATPDATSWFADVYVKAFRLIEEIINDTKIHLEKCKSNTKDPTKGFGNNIILFDSKRGGGKTSAMQSVASFLREDSVPEIITDSTLNKVGSFFVMDSIDPSMISERDSLMRIFLSRLLKEERELEIRYRKEKNRNPDVSLLLEYFSECYENIKYYIDKNTIEHEIDDIESLVYLGSSTELKANIYRLVKEFIAFRVSAGVSESKCIDSEFFVILIDDADLFSGNVFDVCECIRRYLAIPKVIILLAADSEQLLISIYQEFLKQYKQAVMLHDKTDLKEKCYEQAIHYLEKTFPEGRRITLPSIDRVLSSKRIRLGVIYKSRCKDEYEESRPFDMETLKKSDRITIPHQICKAIFIKTGMRISINIDGKNKLIPDTIRELGEMLKMLHEMEEFNEDLILKYYFQVEHNLFPESISAEIEKAERNLNRLCEYFVSIWCAKRLKDKEVHEIGSLINANEDIKKTIEVLEKIICGSDSKAEKKDVTSKSSKDKYSINYLAELVYSEDKDNNVFFAYEFICSVALNRFFLQSILDKNVRTDFIDFLDSPFIDLEGDDKQYPVFIMTLNEIDQNISDSIYSKYEDEKSADKEASGKQKTDDPVSDELESPRKGIMSQDFLKMYCEKSSDIHGREEDVYVFDLWNPVALLLKNRDVFNNQSFDNSITAEVMKAERDIVAHSSDTGVNYSAELMTEEEILPMLRWIKAAITNISVFNRLNYLALAQQKMVECNLETGLDWGGAIDQYFNSIDSEFQNAIGYIKDEDELLNPMQKFWRKDLYDNAFYFAYSQKASDMYIKEFAEQISDKLGDLISSIDEYSDENEPLYVLQEIMGMSWGTEFEPLPSIKGVLNSEGKSYYETIIDCQKKINGEKTKISKTVNKYTTSKSKPKRETTMRNMNRTKCELNRIKVELEKICK